MSLETETLGTHNHDDCAEVVPRYLRQGFLFWYIETYELNSVATGELKMLAFMEMPMLIADQIEDMKKNGTYKEPKKNPLSSMVCRTGFAEPSPSDVVYLVDADVFAYRAAATCDGKMYKVRYKVSNEPGVHSSKSYTTRYKKDMDAYCVANGIENPRITTVFKPEPESYAIHNVAMALESMYNNLVDDLKLSVNLFFEFYLTGATNFRKEVNPSYKEKRKEEHKPVHLNACKQYLMDKFGAMSVDRLEADDVLAIRNKQLNELGVANVIVSVDKDLLQIPGVHYNPVKDELLSVTEWQARYNFWKQVLMGDVTDGIYGISGVGPKTAEKILATRDSDLDESFFIASLLAYLKDIEKNIPQEMAGYLTPKDKYDLALAALTNVARQVHLLRDPKEVWEPPLTRGAILPSEIQAILQETPENGEVQEQV